MLSYIYLIKSLLSKDDVNQPSFAKDGFYTDLDEIRTHLVAAMKGLGSKMRYD